METPVAFQAFVIYRDMGPERSLAAVGRKLGKSKALMERWSSRHGWVLRAHLHDEDLAEAVTVARLVAVARVENGELLHRESQAINELLTETGSAIDKMQLKDKTSVSDVVRLMRIYLCISERYHQPSVPA